MKLLAAMKTVPVCHDFRLLANPALKAWFAVILFILLWTPSSAQEGDEVDPIVEGRYRIRTVIARSDVSGGGIFYYVIFRQPTSEESADENWVLERNVVFRGKMGYDGIARVILAPETDYFMYALYADSLFFGTSSFRTPRSGERFEIPSMGFFDLVDDDTDGDGLSDIREFVIGTDDGLVDTDFDDIGDGAEVQQGTNPLSDIVAATGVIATAPMPGVAYDVIASNNIAIVAARSNGVAIFNIEASRSPTRIGQVDTPGDALLVAHFDKYIAVADGSAGLTVIDITDPPEAKVAFTTNLGHTVTAVATYGTIALAGGSNGDITAIDMLSGTEIDRYQGLSGRIWNLAVRGDYLYALRSGQLSVFRIIDGELEYIRTVTASGSVGAGNRPLRIFIAQDQLYATFTSGLNVFSLADPESPALQERHATSQQGWKQFALNGNGLGVGAVSANSTDDGEHNVSLYSVGEDGTGLTFIGEFETLGLASSLAIYNGRAYVADSNEGLQVINYLAFDRFGVNPEIMLEANANNGTFEEGKLMDITALVTDDVQVRNVQFYVNNEISMTDGNYPFGYRLLTPLIEEGRTSFSVYAVATDTGGNMTTSDSLTIELVPDSTPPRIKSINPGNGAFTGSVRVITAISSEPVDASTLTNAAFSVIEAGDDELFGTDDDIPVMGTLTFDRTTNRIGWDYGSDLDVGIYQVIVQSPLADLAGNEVKESFISSLVIWIQMEMDYLIIGSLSMVLIPLIVIAIKTGFLITWKMVIVMDYLILGNSY